MRSGPLNDARMHVNAALAALDDEGMDQRQRDAFMRLELLLALRSIDELSPQVRQLHPVGEGEAA